MKYILSLLTALIIQPSVAATTAWPSNTFSVDAGVAFTLENDGASDYLFTWTDSSGTRNDIADPTLILTAGQTYTFERTSSDHPFAILNDTLAVTDIGGSLFRDSTDSGVINAAILSPSGDFTATPPPVVTIISWTLTAADIGDYFYTCTVTGHTGMTGRIQVVPEPSSSLLLLLGSSVMMMKRKRNLAV